MSSLKTECDVTDDPKGKKGRSKERRLMLRYPSNAGALVIRETDMMRSGLEAELRDVSPAGMGLSMQEPPDVDEYVKIVATNEIQRFKKETRGVVRHVTKLEDGNYHVGIELQARLTPLEVSMLKMTVPNKSDSDNKWI